MTAFAAGGTPCGMAQESLAFCALIIPVMIRAGSDSMTGVAVILLGAGIGTMGSTFNAFATVIASNAAGTTIEDGLMLRAIIPVASLLAGIAFVMRYAARVKAHPSTSAAADKLDEHRAHFLKDAGDADASALPGFTRTRAIIPSLFGLTFAIMLWSVIGQGWWMGGMSALLLGMSIVVWFVGRLGTETTLTDDIDEGVKGCDVIHTDVWGSLGEPKEIWKERIELLSRYRVDMAVMQKTGNANARFMHCLPAFHDTGTMTGKEIHGQFGITEMEVSNEVFESHMNIAFEQAGNRMHTLKAILVATPGA